MAVDVGLYAMAAIGVIGQPPLRRLCPRPLVTITGTLQGVIGSLNAIAMIITPLVMSALFYTFTGENAPFYFPGAPFFLAAILVAIALWVFLSVRPKDA